MTVSLAALSFAGLLASQVLAPPLPLSPGSLARLEAAPTERALAGGSLRLVRLDRIQTRLLHELAGRPRGEVMERLVEEVYRPYTDLWNGYLGDEQDFRQWVRLGLLDAGHPAYREAGAAAELDLDAVFEKVVPRYIELTGRRPQGVWYAVFGPGWTNMGGLGGGRMVLDFSNALPRAEVVERTLPHELNHQVKDRPAQGSPEDPDAGTVLDRILEEGFATWVNHLYWKGAVGPAEAIDYSPEDWDWSVAHEAELFAAAVPILASRERPDIDRVAARNASLVEGGPGAAGYFVGFRIVDAYVRRHGPDSWKEIYDLPVREVLARSGYAP